MDPTAQQATDINLPRSETLLKEIAALSHIGGWEIDFKLGKSIWTDEVYHIHELPLDFEPSLPADLNERSLDYYTNFYGAEAATIKAAFLDARHRGIPYDLELPFITAKGKSLWVRAKGVPIVEAGEVVRLFGFLMDITERKQAQARLQQQALQEQAFNRVVQTIRNSLDLEMIFATATQEFSQLLRLDRVGISQYLPEESCWLSIEECLQSPNLPSMRGLRIADQDNPIAEQLKRREPVVVDDMQTIPGQGSISQLYPGAWVLVPLEGDGKVWGCLTGLRLSSSMSFTEEEVNLARRFADQLAIAIQQASLCQQLRELNQELEQRVRDRTAALQESEEKFRQLAENISHVFCLEDTEGQILYTSPSYEQIWGRPVTELYQNSASWLESVHPEDRDRVLAQQAILQQHCEGEMEYRIIRPNGDVRWIYDRSFPICNEQGDIYRIAGFAEDVTDRKQAETALQMSEQNLRTIFNNASTMLFVHDANGTLLEVNQRVLEQHQVTREQALQISIIDDCSAPDNPFYCLQDYWARAMAGEIVHFEWKTIKFTDRTLFDAEVTLNRIIWNGEPVILATAQDVTTRKQAELEIRRNRDLFEAMFEESADAIMLCDLMTSVVLDCNQRAVELFEADQKQTLLGIEGHTLRKTPRTPAELVEARLALQQQQSLKHEYEYRTCKGHYFWGSLALKSIQVAEQRMVLVRITDISDRKQAEAALKTSEQNLRTIFNTVSNQIWVHDAEGKVLDINDRVPEQTKMEREQVLHLSLLQRLPLSEQARAQSYWQQAAAGETVHFECTIPRFRDGSMVNLDITLHRIIWGGQAAILANVLDISDRKQTELRLQRQAETDQLLALIAQMINQSIHLDEILETCLEHLRQFLQCDRAIVIRFEANYQNALKLEAVSRVDLSLQEDSFKNPGFSPDWFESLRQGKMIIRNDIQSENLPRWHTDFLAQVEIRADVVVPILQADQLWGLLIIHQCDRPREWQPPEINLLNQLGLQIGTASQKASLYTQLENQLAQKKVLLKEVNHRVKNNLQMISAVLRLQSKAANNPIVSEALSDTRNRLQAISLIHEILYQYSNLGQIQFDNYIQRLANNILAACSTCPDQIHLVLQLQPVIFDLETAIPCGLLLNEIITNAIKHGFPDQRCGEIRIILEHINPPNLTEPIPAKSPEPLDPSPSSPIISHYKLTIQDNGIGIPKTVDFKNLKSLGLKLVYDLALQLQGNLEVKHQQGTLFCLTFPDAEVAKKS